MNDLLNIYRAWEKRNKESWCDQMNIQILISLIKYITDEDKDEKVLENQKVLLTPIVRNGRQATVGYKPEVWKEWK